MSMNREAYRLANEIGNKCKVDGDCREERLSEFDMKKYQRAISEEIIREKRATKRNFRKGAAAACAALALVACTAVFGEEVNAAIRHLGWSIGSAFGLSGDLADYREVVDTSVTDQGYVITLQEAVVSNEKLVVAYTLQREDGNPMDEILTPNGSLYVNGKAVTDGGSGSAGFLDESQTTVGVMDSYEISGMDLSGENEYRLKFDEIGFEDSVKGSWEFAFAADGADLIGDTRHVSIDRAFTLPDGVTVTLEEITFNELEQRISYSKSGDTQYLMMIKAVDSEGSQVEFGVRSQDKTSGYMQNEEVIDNGRISEDAKAVTLSLYAVELPEGDGQISDEYEPVGAPFELEL